MPSTLDGIPSVCWARFRRWALPPNWSRRDWWPEVVAQAQAAAWDATTDYSPERDGLLERHIYRRVVASVIRRYRQEWRYTSVCGGDYPCSPDEDHVHRTLEDMVAAEEVSIPDVDLREAISLLRPEEQHLIRTLFWEGHSEAELAREWGVSQPAVSKRKHLALRRLRDLLTPSAAQ